MDVVTLEIPSEYEAGAVRGVLLAVPVSIALWLAAGLFVFLLI